MKARDRLTLMVPGLVALGLTACSEGNPGKPSGQDQRSSALPDEFEVRSEQASYRVPVPEDLAPWATYAVDRVELEYDGQRIEIRYDFPRWLNGVGADVVLEGTYAVDTTGFEVTAPGLGSGTCVREHDRFECSEILSGISVDRSKAEERMQASNLDSEEIEQRLRVTDRFATDPIGVLEFQLDILE